MKVRKIFGKTKGETMKIQRILIMLLAVVMLLGIAACNKEPAQPPIEPESSTIELFENGASKYTVIYAEKSEDYKAAAAQFKKLFKEKTGVELAVDIDYKNSEVKDYEIIIGETTRENTELTDAQLSDIHQDGFVIKAVGEKLWICGVNKDSTIKGVEYFIEQYVTADKASLPKDLSYTQKRSEAAQLAGFSISGNAIGEYVIAANTSVSAVVEMAKELQTEIWDITGAHLPIVSLEKADASAKKIVIEKLDSDQNPYYTVKTDGANLFLQGTDNDRLSLAVDYVGREYFGRRTNIFGKYYDETATTLNVENADVTFRYERLESLTISGKDISEFTIVYEKGAPSSVEFAAGELQKYLVEATGVAVKLAERSDELKDKPLIKFVYNEAMGESYSLKTDASGLVITGGARGVLYGAYNFLEDCLGWMFMPYNVNVFMPESDTVAIDNLDVTYNQYFEYRSSYFYSQMNESFATKNMLNCNILRSDSRDYSQYGGFYGYTGGFSHTIMALLGDDSHEASIGANPCYYVESTYNTVLASIKEMLAKDPDASIISVSQTDANVWCECEACQAALAVGNRTDYILGFVNKIADAVKEEYPNLRIQTFAYGSTQAAPLSIVPRDNVIIQLCSIRCCYNHPIASECTKTSKQFMTDLKAWAAITDNLYIWNYATNFRYFLFTFPNFDVLRENMKLYADYGVKGIYEQGDLNNFWGKFEDLTCYMLAKLMENPYMTDDEYDTLLNRFMQGYYGEGWEYIREYYDFLCEATVDSCFGIYAVPESMYDAQAFFEKGDEVQGWIEKAMELTSDDAQKRNLKCVLTSFRYMKLYLTYNEVRRKGTTEEFAALKQECIEVFDAICLEDWRLLDVHSSLAHYVDDVEKTAHPKKWCISEHRMDSVADHGMPGGETGTIYQ